jgi:hypothetical protein
MSWIVGLLSAFQLCLAKTIGDENGGAFCSFEPMAVKMWSPHVSRNNGGVHRTVPTIRQGAREGTEKNARKTDEANGSPNSRFYTAPSVPNWEDHYKIFHSILVGYSDSMKYHQTRSNKHIYL